MPPSQNNPYRILSLDGGGIRGLMTAVWLHRLEDRLDGPLHQYFDLVAGTSTGAILACAVSRGISAKKIIDLYVERGREVFPGTADRLWSRLSRTFSEGLSAPKYDGEGLEKALKAVFRTTLFRTLKVKPTLVTSYDTLTRTPVVFKNTQDRFQSIKVWEICKASAVAPSYFPAHVTEIAGARTPLIDGGVVANNPSACAIAEGIRINEEREPDRRIPLDDFVVASFGTGQATRPISIEDAQEWGALEWAIPIVDVLFDGSADAADYISRQLIRSANYFRFQTVLHEAYDDMDNADRTNIEALMRIATAYIDSSESQDRLDRLVERLADDG